MARVFVSHAREELALACGWHQLLTEVGHKVFLAHDLRDGIAVGEEWEQRLRHELRRADAVVCAITSAYLASRFCRDEVRIALIFGCQLLPVQVEPDVFHPLLADLHHIGMQQAGPRLVERLRSIDDTRSDDRPPADPAAVRRRNTGVASVQLFASRDEPVPCGRTSEVTTLLDLLDPTAHGGPTTMAVTGLPGVGKTRLVKYVGSQAKDLFRGGAAYVDMNGYDPDPQARTTAEQVYGPLLRALGVEGWHGMVDSGRCCSALT